PMIPEIRHRFPVVDVAFSPDGRRIATAQGGDSVRRDRLVRLWDAQTGEQIGTEMAEDTGLAYSRDGSRILTWSEGGFARVWDAESGKPVSPPLRHGSWVNCATFSPDGEEIATASEDRLVRVWNLVTDTGLKAIFRKGDFLDELKLADARFSPDGRTVLAGFYGPMVGS